MGGKNKAPPQQTQKHELPQEIKDYYRRELSSYRPEVFTGQRLAEQSPEELQYIQRLGEVGAAENPFYSNARGILSDFYSTPFEDSAHKAILDDALAEAGSNIEQVYARAGRSGSPAFAKAHAAGLTRAGHDVLSDYNRQRLGALSQAGQLSSQELSDAQARLGLLGQAGSLQSKYGQEVVDSLRAPLDERNRAEAQRINAITGLLTQGTRTTVEPGAAPKSNRFAGALGGALAGGQLFGPWGAAAGGILGLLS